MRSSIPVRTLTAVLGVSLVGVAGYFAYVLLKKKDDEDDYNNTVPKNAKNILVEVKIPKEAIKNLIGRNGANIKQIQEQSNTRISFKDDNKDECTERVCMIKGLEAACALAETLITEYITTQPVLECFEMDIPQSYVGRIIGRCGEQIFEISTSTGANLHFIDDDKNTPTRKLLIKGSIEQINLAKLYIDDIIKRCNAIQKKFDMALAKREPRGPTKNNETAKVESPKVETISSLPGQPNSQFDVYVSAMIDPSRFWVQIVGPKATELDQLVEIMTDYYGKEENREFHVLDNVEAGNLVAALFKYDNKWYRAEVLNIIEGNSSEAKEAELYYVDYGDTDILPCKELYELRTDFLQLHFQAIECYLGRVEPLDESWTEEAIDKFEEWTHVAQWKKLSAKIDGYTTREKTRAKREGSPVPGIELIDMSNERDVNIAEELVKSGYAVFKKETDIRSSSSRATSTSNISVDSL